MITTNLSNDTYREINQTRRYETQWDVNSFLRNTLRQILQVCWVTFWCVSMWHCNCHRLMQHTLSSVIGRCDIITYVTWWRVTSQYDTVGCHWLAWHYNLRSADVTSQLVIGWCDIATRHRLTRHLLWHRHLSRTTVTMTPVISWRDSVTYCHHYTPATGERPGRTMVKIERQLLSFWLESKRRQAALSEVLQ